MMYMEWNDYKRWKMPFIPDKKMWNDLYTNKTETLFEQ